MSDPIKPTSPRTTSDSITSSPTGELKADKTSLPHDTKGAPVEPNPAQIYKPLTPHDFPSIVLAAQKSNIPTVQEGLAGLRDINEQQDGKGLIHWGSYYGLHSLLQLLIERHADFNKPDSNGVLPIHLAPDDKTIEILLDGGARIGEKNPAGLTRLHQAAKDGHTPIVRLLLRHGANIREKVNGLLLPVHLAAMYGHAKTVKLLLDNHPDITEVDHVRTANWALHACDPEVPLEMAGGLETLNIVGQDSLKRSWGKRQYHTTTFEQ